VVAAGMGRSFRWGAGSSLRAAHRGEDPGSA
jgi:hypothetical protein